MPTEWIVFPRQVLVVDGDRPGIYELKTAHESTCSFTKTGEPPCDCDFSIGELTFLHGLDGPN